MMGSVEWNKKEDLLADQAFRHLKVLILYLHLLIILSLQSSYKIIICCKSLSNRQKSMQLHMCSYTAKSKHGCQFYHLSWSSLLLIKIASSH